MYSRATRENLKNKEELFSFSTRTTFLVLLHTSDKSAGTDVTFLFDSYANDRSTANGLETLRVRRFEPDDFFDDFFNFLAFYLLENFICFKQIFILLSRNILDNIALGRDREEENK